MKEHLHDEHLDSRPRPWARSLEGDTPAFLGLLPNGLNEPDRPDWGGWGGRYELRVPEPTPLSNGLAAADQKSNPVAETRPIWTDTVDTYTRILPHEFGGAFRPDTDVHSGNTVTLLRWRDAQTKATSLCGARHSP